MIITTLIENTQADNNTGLSAERAWRKVAASAHRNRSSDIRKSISSVYLMIIHMKSTDVVRKIIFRYQSVPTVDSFTNIFIQGAMEDISIKSSS